LIIGLRERTPGWLFSAGALLLGLDLAKELDRMAARSASGKARHCDKAENPAPRQMPFAILRVISTPWRGGSGNRISQIKARIQGPKFAGELMKQL
jgi:hypothetical protein